MQKNIQSDLPYEDEIDLRELFKVLWINKIKIIIFTSIFALGSIIYSLSLPNQYKATVLLAPAQESENDLSGSLGRLGGLASVAGFSFDNNDVDKSKIAQEVMESWSFIDSFISKNNLSVKIYAVNNWSKESNQLYFDENLYDMEKKRWLIENSSGVQGPPTSWELYENFSGRLEILQSQAGLISISIEYFSPQIAKKWVDMYVDSINQYMQEREIVKVTNNINYLKDQINKTSISEMKEAFYNIMEEQIKNKMLAEASPDYVFAPVGPSMIPEKKSKPSRSIICFFGTLIGFLLSTFSVFMIHYLKNSEGDRAVISK